MATLAFAVKALTQPSVKGRRFKLVTVTGNTDIGAEGVGYLRTAAQLGFNVIEGCIGGLDNTGVYNAVGVVAAGGATINFLYFNADDGVQAAAGENGVDGTITQFLVIGY